MLIECILELERGNPEEVFYENYIGAVRKLKLMDMISTNYFLDETLNEFLVNLPKIKKMTNGLIN
ncbi:HD containing hydrolase-like enzyme [compost metagenome]